jgi:hypothetical protein
VGSGGAGSFERGKGFSRGRGSVRPAACLPGAGARACGCTGGRIMGPRPRRARRQRRARPPTARRAWAADCPPGATPGGAHLARQRVPQAPHYEAGFRRRLVHLERRPAGGARGGGAPRVRVAAGVARVARRGAGVEQLVVAAAAAAAARVAAARRRQLNAAAAQAGVGRAAVELARRPRLDRRKGAARGSAAASAAHPLPRGPGGIAAVLRLHAGGAGARGSQRGRALA